MPGLVHFSTPLRAGATVGVFAVLASLALAAHGATAQSATGTVTGRVVWGACIRGIPLPMLPSGQAQSGTAVAPDGSAPEAQIAPGSRPMPVNGLPAGAVLVAVQNTAISARTDEAGKFTLGGVPAGQYMTVAAGPVADSVSATADRPNVLVSGGQSADIGTLSLGGSGGPYAGACRFPTGVDGSMPMSPPTPPSPGDVTTP
ncbi:MAG: hypothetical protein ACR2IK_07490 [Chloroflexota bacterium]